MSYQLPRQQHSAGNNAPSPPGAGGSQNQEEVLQAKERITRIIEAQRSDLKRKFEQIRHSLVEKEEHVRQELDQILNDRLNELDTCAKNINLLSETYSLNQQKLGTNTLGEVNFKILTTVTASIEEFRKKIDTELSIRILWGSQDIEQSIQNVCTISYASEDHMRRPPAPADSQSTHKQATHSGGTGPCQCVYCQSPSHSQSHPKCETRGQGQAHGQEQKTNFQVRENHIFGTIQPHNLKEPYSVQPVYPPIFVPVGGPVMPRRIMEPHLPQGDPSSQRIVPMACTSCGQIFASIAEIESHKREGQCVELMTSSLSSRRGSVRREPGTQELLPSQSHFHQLGQQQQSAAFNNFCPVLGDTSSRYRQGSNPPAYTPFANSQHVPVSQPQQPTVSGISNCSPSVQQINFSPRIVANNAPLLDTPQHRLQNSKPDSHALPYSSHPEVQSQNRIPPELPAPRAYTQPIVLSKKTPAKAEVCVNELPPQSSPANNLPFPIYPAPPPVQKQAIPAQNHLSHIRKFKVLLLWYKQVDTIGDHIFYFDNYDGCCELVWNRRQEHYICETELEEGQHFGQLSIDDAGVYTVEKFHIPLIAPSDQSTVILKVVPTS